VKKNYPSTFQQLFFPHSTTPVEKLKIKVFYRNFLVSARKFPKEADFAYASHPARTGVKFSKVSDRNLQRIGRA